METEGIAHNGITGQDDQMLIACVRGGSHQSYGQLYSRYVGRARGHAMRLCANPQDAEDVAAEAFAKIFQLLCHGRGPTSNFSAYLRQTIRSVAVDHFRSGVAVDSTDRLGDEAALDDEAETVADRVGAEAVLVAFRSLPERWRMALWLTEIEDRNPREVAEVFRQNPHGFSAMTYRARWGLRVAYLTTLLDAGSGPSCVELRHMVEAINQPMTRRQVVELSAHVSECQPCTDFDTTFSVAVEKIARFDSD